MGGGMPGVGGGGATGKVYQLKDTQLSDDGTAIPSYYTTHYFPERAVEQSLSLGAHRKLFSYLTMFVEGAGNLSLTSFTDSVSAPQTQQPLPLSSLSDKDVLGASASPSTSAPTSPAPGSVSRNSRHPCA
jgi:hypothetical protein